MNEPVRQALDRGRLIDITTIGSKSGQPRRLEIWFHNLDGTIYITGTPGKRDWYANLLVQPASSNASMRSAPTPSWIMLPTSRWSIRWLCRWCTGRTIPNGLSHRGQRGHRPAEPGPSALRSAHRRMGRLAVGP